MELHIEIEREDDGRWIAEVIELPGVIAYGPTRAAAFAAVKALALRAVADQIEHGAVGAELAGVSFVTS